MSTIDEGGPAFPVPGGAYRERLSNGITVRQWYAGQASKAFLQDCDDGTDIDYERAASMVFKMADAMIAEGKKPADDSVADDLLAMLKRLLPLARRDSKANPINANHGLIEHTEKVIAAAEKRVGR